MTAQRALARLHEAEQLPAEQWQAALNLAVDAEQSLIGSLLYNPDTYGAVASIIRPHYFSEPVHRQVFEAFQECRTAGRRGSLQEVRQALGPKLVAQNIAGDVNLSEYVVRLSQEGPTTFSAGDGARSVRDYWALRELFSAAMVGPEAMGLPDRVLRETFDRIDAVRMDIAESSAVRRSIGAIGADVLARAERIADGLEEEPGVTTGLPGLDRIVLGYRPGELVIIAGRPGMGKTTLATSSALACSAIETDSRAGGAGFFALELGEEAIGARCLADLAWNPHGATPTHSAIRSGNLHAADRSRLHFASEALAKRALEIDGRSSTSIGEIEASCRRCSAGWSAAGNSSANRSAPATGTRASASMKSARLPPACVTSPSAWESASCSRCSSTGASKAARTSDLPSPTFASRATSRTMPTWC